MITESETRDQGIGSVIEYLLSKICPSICPVCMGCQRRLDNTRGQAGPGSTVYLSKYWGSLRSHPAKVEGGLAAPSGRREGGQLSGIFVFKF